MDMIRQSVEQQQTPHGSALPMRLHPRTEVRGFARYWIKQKEEEAPTGETCRRKNITAAG